MENEYNDLGNSANSDVSFNYGGNFAGDSSQNEYESSGGSQSEFNSEDAVTTASSKTVQAINITTFMAMIASVAVVVVAIVVIASGASNYSAFFNSVQVYGNSFTYDISVGLDYEITEGTSIDFSSVDTSLRLVVVNSTTSMVVDLQNDENNSAETPVLVETLSDSEYHVTYSFVGTVDGLDAGTIYQIEIISVSGEESVTLVSKEIKTADGAVSQINGVTYKCNCLTDDTFEFTIDYIDENNFYSDFTYSILNIDKSQTIFDNIQIENASQKQVVQNITNLAGGDYILQINYLSSAYSETGDETGQEQAEQTIQIEIKI